MRIDRRRALGLLGLGAAAPGAARAQSRGVAFQHGVASGDPLQDRVVLWTRITPTGAGAAPVPYRWRLQPADGGPERSGEGVTGPERDYTVKVDVGGLRPGTEHRFRFEAAGVSSPEGRTRTLPAGATKDVVLAIASCALYPNGYFNAYRAIADLPRVDAVLHLGDYIYEYGGERSYGMDSPLAAQRAHQPNREILSLADYRLRHAQYKSDPDLQAAHARAPWIVVWDDHETANDSWAGGAENHDPPDGDWAARKAAALKAYFEWMPIREPAPGRPLEATWRSFRFGDVANLIMVETRLAARDRQLDYETDLGPEPSPEKVAAFRQRLADPSRKLMGAEQLNWVVGEAGRPGAVWQVLGNQVLMLRLQPPSLRRVLGEARAAEVVAGASDALKGRIARMEAMAALGLPTALDLWDGYPAERERLLQGLVAAKANAIVLTGDSHSAWANELHTDDGRRAAVEFGATSITSPGGGDSIRDLDLPALYMAANPEIRYVDMRAKGFTLLTLTRESALAEYFAVSTIHAKPFETKVVKRMRATPGADGVSALQDV
jgi:alkaline phosphatase D